MQWPPGSAKLNFNFKQRRDIMLETPKARQQWQSFHKLAPQEIAALLAMSKAVEASGLERELLELVKLRSSQLNGCAFCLQMHATDARKMGMSEEKLQLLAAWREAPVYSSRERAALAWTESLTLVASHHGVSDEVYDDAVSVFSDAELAHLTSAVLLINSWNRLAIAYRFTPTVAAASAHAA
jgi:AhpD family alkylhydroperoxidase